MSSIAITGGATGTGVFSLLAPSTSTNRVLTLPDAAGTVALQGGAGVGKVLQVVSGSTAIQVSSSTDTFVDTGLTASITPTSATSKILVLVNQNGCQKSSANSSTAIDIRLLRNGSAITDLTGALAGTGTAIENIVTTGTCFLDLPATTSSITYKTDFRSRNNTASVSVQYASVSRSTITLMEIAA